MSRAIPTECMNCGATATLTLTDGISWGKKHGPKKCKAKEEEQVLCGLDSCDVVGECQARSQCRYMADYQLAEGVDDE